MKVDPNLLRELAGMVPEEGWHELCHEAANEIERLRALVEAGDNLYSTVVDQETTKGQREAVAEYARLSNAYRLEKCNGPR